MIEKLLSHVIFLTASASAGLRADSFWIVGVAEPLGLMAGYNDIEIVVKMIKRRKTDMTPYPMTKQIC